MSSCNCCTKAPDAEYHDEHCRYKLICELETKTETRITTLEKALNEAADVLNGCRYSEIPAMKKARTIANNKDKG